MNSPFWDQMVWIFVDVIVLLFAALIQNVFNPQRGEIDVN